ncbi:serine/threonine-protein kinase RIO2 [Suhomyces tanzawaensis NRRL Y-17324]|uniref:Serine/threonine-protein kinase RIO2 n=1 Tax=Suhomyces tanzawaensis NRRL Y-17324 TaxID=984487 RepID=A0A1E4SLB4_9ASCO|nr:serine/threonine-protein kinase RIO2 [Suhomyces tanzawaensis NRRL Y-17324]ODV80278.1 serine/threonine-protein kinase RIO2 [Suhomyces tanzawaensis NRRL Y-17324]
MKLDTAHMRYLTSDDWKVLQAVEIGTRNHELVPTEMIHSLGGMKSTTGTNRLIGDLAKFKLLARLRNSKYDGFRLTYNGIDFLALKSMLNRDSLYSVGTMIGVGKESDIYSVSDSKGVQKVMKIHRLGRTSFKTVKNNRDYLKRQQGGNWMYLSRLAAQKEYEFMVILYNNGFNVPVPYDYSRHCVLMEWIRGIPMKHLRKHDNHKKLYSELMNFIVKLANHGLIHCDFNEFNIIIRDKEDAKKHTYDFVVIDFPQCVSIDHQDAEEYFNRDVEGIRAFFEKKFRYTPESDPTMFDTEGYGEGYKYAYPSFKRDVERTANLDVEVKASGYAKKRTGEDSDLEKAVQNMRLHDDEDDEEEDDEEEYDEEEEDDDDYDLEEEEEDEEDEGELQEKNEQIIKALSEGKSLKMDKLGNYILE